MARYIDSDLLVKEMNERYDELIFEYGEYDHYTDGYGEAIDRLENFPTADVVPRSEVDWHREAELNAQRIIELESEIAKAKTEVAREIFEEIEDRLLPSNMSGEFRCDSVEWFDYFDLHLAEDIADLKKKYTEGKQ